MMSNLHEQLKCPACGGTTTTKTSGHVEEILCNTCDWTQLSTVYPEDAVGLIDEDPEVVSVHIEWANHKSLTAEVMTARRTFEALAKIPIQELLEQAKKSATCNLGTYILPLAIELQEQGNANGLRVSFNHISE